MFPVELHFIEADMTIAIEMTTEVEVSKRVFIIEEVSFTGERFNLSFVDKQKWLERNTRQGF